MPSERAIRRYTRPAVFRTSFPFHIERADLTRRHFPYHEHEFSELVVITGGESMHITEDGEHALSAGDVFVFNGRHAHGFRDSRHLRLYNVMYDPERLLAPRSGLRILPGFHALFVLEPRYRKQHKFRSRLHLSMDDLAKTAQFLASLLDEYQNESPGFEVAIRGLFLQLVVFLSRRYGEAREDASRSILRMGSVMSYMEAHSHEPLALAHLARMARMSVNNFLRVFREATAHSPIDYLIRLRVMRSCELLRTTDEKITSLALRTGFSDSNYFAKVFRKVMGMSPGEYRRRGDHGG
jgi:AraC family L-rhamnose operon transcriptional activator RhaR